MKSYIAIAAASLVVLGLFFLQVNPTVVNLRGTAKEVPDYNMYVFAVQWGKTMCLQGGSSCENKLANIPKNEMSIHGLWPSLLSGGRLPDCNQGSEISIVDDGSSTFLTARKYWPSLTGGNEKFWNHEYNKHGYCYSNKIQDFDYKNYFQKTLDVFQEKKINTLILDTFGTQSGNYAVSLSTLKSKLNEQLGGEYYSLACKTISKKQYLQEIRFSLDLDFKFIDNNLSSNCSGKKDILIPYRK